MENGLVLTQHISFILVFLEGIVSFFSPCVLPLIPVYMSYLAGSGKTIGENSEIQFNRKKVFLHTMFFVLGISISFFILGLSFTALGSFFSENKTLFTRIGGIIIVLLGLVQIGFLDFKFIQKEIKFNFKLADKKMNPFIAMIMGFTFSFAWTPCIGPALSSVLIMASGAKTALTGNLLVLVYALGFLIPFFILGLFTSRVLNFLKNKKNVLKYTIKIGGAILIIMGVMTYTGWMNQVSGYLNSITLKTETEAEESVETSSDDSIVNAEQDTSTQVESKEPEVKSEKIAAFDFTLYDQYGNTHTLSDYKGKVVFLNFWATWCPPCKKEMPDIEALYQEYNLNQDDVIFLGIANPSSDAYPNNNDSSEEEIISFLEDNNYTFPVLFDTTGEILANYYISALPTTFMIDKEGNIVGYVPGMMTKNIMINVIDQAIKATE